MRILLLIVASLFATPSVMAQEEPEYRLEVGAGLGGVAYSGDFSGGFFLNDSVLSRAQFDHRNDKLHIFDEDLLKEYEEMRNKMEGISRTNALPRIGYR